ncbi:hypothetical protein Tco_1201381 [Tanacetum coccineum]
MSTKNELTGTITQGVSNDVLVSIEGFEDIKKEMYGYRVLKKEALITTWQKTGSVHMLSRILEDCDIEATFMDQLMHCTNPSQPFGFLSKEKTVSFVTEIHTDFLLTFIIPRNELTTIIRKIVNFVSLLNVLSALRRSGDSLDQPDHGYIKLEMVMPNSRWSRNSLPNAHAQSNKGHFSASRFKNHECLK